MDSLGPLLTVIGSILLILLQSWRDGQPDRIKEKRDAEIQQGRQALVDDNAAVDGSAALVTERLDRLLNVETGGAPGGNAGGESPADPQGGTSLDGRLAALGISVGETTGTGGSL